MEAEARGSPGAEHGVAVVAVPVAALKVTPTVPQPGIGLRPSIKATVPVNATMSAGAASDPAGVVTLGAIVAVNVTSSSTVADATEGVSVVVVAAAITGSDSVGAKVIPL